MDSKKKTDELQHPPWRQLFRTTEGLILLLGIFLALGGLVATVAVSHWSAEASRVIGAMSFASFIFGRTVSMSIGYADGYDFWVAVAVNMWVETVMVLLFYPVFVLSMRQLVIFPKLARFLKRTHDAAERHHDVVLRYGTIGLFAFVFIPFWMTGPVVGCAIGYLIGFPARRTLPVVLFSSYIAIVAWALLLFGIYEQVAGMAPWAPVLVIVIVTVIVAAGFVLNRRGRKRRSR